MFEKNIRQATRKKGKAKGIKGANQTATSRQHIYIIDIVSLMYTIHNIYYAT